jgi:DNA-binding transcriptional regulator YhcF (GntR family)
VADELRQKVIDLFLLNQDRIFTPNGVAQSTGSIPMKVAEVLDELEADGIVEGMEFPGTLAKRRYRLVKD